MGKFSRDKGGRGERLIVAKMREHGFDAQRVPLSGAALGAFAGDIAVTVCRENWRGEVKLRAKGFASLYKFLADHQFLVVKADRQEPLVLLRLSDVARIGAIAQKAKP